MDENLAKFISYVCPCPFPTPPQQPADDQEIYENFKLPEELWSGTTPTAY